MALGISVGSCGNTVPFFIHQPLQICHFSETSDKYTFLTSEPQLKRNAQSDLIQYKGLCELQEYLKTLHYIAFQNTGFTLSIIAASCLQRSHEYKNT